MDNSSNKGLGAAKVIIRIRKQVLEDASRLLMEKSEATQLTPSESAVLMVNEKIIDMLDKLSRDLDMMIVI